VSETLTPAQRRTLPARQALEAKFASPTEKTAYFRELARRSHERRLTLSSDEAAAVLQAYTLLRAIAERAQHSADSSDRQQERTNGGAPRGQIS
jgi:hypothetical protein